MRGKKGRTRKKKVFSENYYAIGSRLATLEMENGPKDSQPVPIESEREKAGWFKVESLAGWSLFLVPILALALVVIFLPYISKKDRRQYSYYPSFRAAASAGILQEGWVPRFIPDGSTELHEAHNEGSGSGWISFRFPPSSGQRMVASFTALTPEEVAKLEIPGIADKWWPDVLKGKMGGKEMAGWGFYLTNRTFRGKQALEYMAVDWGKSEAYIWR